MNIVLVDSAFTTSASVSMSALLSTLAISSSSLSFSLSKIRFPSSVLFTISNSSLFVNSLCSLLEKNFSFSSNFLAINLARSLSNFSSSSSFRLNSSSSSIRFFSSSIRFSFAICAIDSRSSVFSRSRIIFATSSVYFKSLSSPLHNTTVLNSLCSYSFK